MTFIKIIDIFFQCLIISILFLSFYIIVLIVADNMFSHDIDFTYGRHKKKRIRQMSKGFFTKILFLDIKHLVKKWHYVVFIINFIFAILSLIDLNAYVISYEIMGGPVGIIQNIGTFCSFIFIITVAIMSSIYMHLRWWRVRSKKKYRPKGKHGNR